MRPPKTVTIARSMDGEYRVPGPGTYPSPRAAESAAYYTDDKTDAIGTARLMHGPNVTVKIKRVINHPQ
ncbi:MAG TPA: hypothetical protein V6C97_27005 [Oculatellaceae cyanobacterium]